MEALKKVSGSLTELSSSYYYYQPYTCTHTFWLLVSLSRGFVSHRLPLRSSLHKLPEDVELEWLQQAEVLYYRLERSHSNAVPQLKHNPWSLKCHQQHLQRMKENAKHRNQYSILSFSMSQGESEASFMSAYSAVETCPDAGCLIQRLAIGVFDPRSPVSKALPLVT